MKLQHLVAKHWSDLLESPNLETLLNHAEDHAKQLVTDHHYRIVKGRMNEAVAIGRWNGVDKHGITWSYER